jgi:hypothetical protein
MNNLIQIPNEELEEFKQLIRDYRAKYIPTNPELIERILSREKERINDVIENQKISEVISYLREEIYNEFLQEESKFNVEVIKSLEAQFDTPREILQFVTKDLKGNNFDEEKLNQRVNEMCGEYAGRISPYIYQLSLSNTNARRARAGKTFEAVIYKLYEIFGFQFESQKKIGKEHFQEHGLGKIVDSLLPSVDAFEKRRDKVIIGTMKTTLRERWQEVIEEISRTGLPQIYLLTMDDDISISKAEQMGKHNIVLVTPKYVKEQEGLKSRRNIMSFEEYFLSEVPDKLSYWK